MADTAGHESTLRHLWRGAWRRPRGRWPALRWGLGLLLPLAVLLWGISVLLAPDDPDLFRIVVESQATGESIEGASVIVGKQRYLTDASGSITIDPLPPGTTLRVSAAGHESVQSASPDEPGADVRVSLSAVLVLGSVADIVSGAPVQGAVITVLDASGAEVASTGTDGSGSFVFKFIPEDAEIVVTHDIYGEHRQALDDQRSLFIQLQPPPVTGTVVGADGEPVARARVTGAQAEAETDTDGTFTIDGVGQGEELIIAMDGLGSAVVPVSGTDLGDIVIPATEASPQASPFAGEGEG